jgi:pseudouridine-5'-phosphate glycosidase
MKDITVALELTVPKDMPDASVRVFVEEAVKQALQRGITNFEVCPHLVDVVSIKDGSVSLGSRSTGWRDIGVKR